MKKFLSVVCIAVLALITVPMQAQSATATITAAVPGSTPGNATLTLLPRSTITSTLSNWTGGPATTVNLSLTDASTRLLAASLQFTVFYTTADVTSVVVTAGAASTAAAKTISCTPGTGLGNPAPAAGQSANTCILSGMNTTVIGNGVVALVAVAVSPTIAGPSTSITVGNFMASNIYGRLINSAVAAVGGLITITSTVAIICLPVSFEGGEDAACTATLSAAPTVATTLTITTNSPTSIQVPSVPIVVAISQKTVPFVVANIAP